jgi:hypothetical protein
MLVMDEEIKITLSNEEALVLFEFLSRWSDTDKFDLMDQSEQRVLWNILSDLETTLAEPISKNYHDLLALARNKVRDTTE